MKKFTTSDKILIVGGTGFIGQHLGKRCLQDTFHVTYLSLRGQQKRQSLQKAELLSVDISNKEQLKSVLHGRSFDYVFNLGGYIDHVPYSKGGRKIIDSHFNGLMNLIDCLDLSNLKGFVQVGSSDEYGNASAPQKETMRESPISPYSLAKTASSHFIKMMSNTEGFPGVVLRFFLVYGPGQDDNRFLPQIIKACLSDSEFKTSEGKQLRDFCYVGDIVDAMVNAALSVSAKGNIINVASGRPISIREVVEEVMRIVGKGRPLWKSFPYRIGENMQLYADIGLSKKILNWEPSVSLREGLQKTIEYYSNLNEDK